MVWTRYQKPIHVAPSLNALAAEFDRLYPNRNRASDGALGNASHQAERSDHNPDWSAPGSRRAVIRAIDLTTTTWGMAGQPYTPAQRQWHIDLVEALIAAEIANPVDRLWYVIHWIPGDPYPKIWSRTTGWRPKRYYGASPHDHHFHTSILASAAAENDTKSWFKFDHPTKQEDDMPTPKDLWTADIIPAPEYAKKADPTNPTWKAESFLIDTNQRVEALKRDLADLGQKLDAVLAAVSTKEQS